MNLRIGHISYLNCVPFFQNLRCRGFSGEIVSGVPSELNALLACGAIDLSISSSFEYAKNARQYLLLPDQSISSRGAVQSVLLFSRKALKNLTGEEILVTGESATSIHLLQVLLREYFGCSALSCRVPEGSVEQVIATGGTALLIGDRAMQAHPPYGTRVFDLGELWWRKTGLPFVYALWILREETAHAEPEAVRRFMEQLEAGRLVTMAQLDQIALQQSEVRWMGAERLISYWRQISYDLTQDHLQGLELFFTLCRKHGLLPEVPELRFFT